MVSNPSLLRQYTWTFPGAPLRVCIHLEVVSTIREHLRQAANSAGQSGDLRGILLGQRSGGQNVVQITGALAPFAYQADQLATILKELRGSANSVPVGFYRAETGSQLRLNDEDYRIGREHFPHPMDVFLLIGPSDQDHGTATFFFWSQDHIAGDVALLEFPFDPSLLAALEHTRSQERERTQAPADRPTATQLPSPAASTWLRRHPRGRMVALLGSVAALLFAGTLYLRPVSTSKISPPVVAPRSVLGLKVQRQGEDLVLTWDREAVARSGATAGLLSLRDGPAEKEIGLDIEQLRSGNILFSPESDRVRVQLTIILPDQRTANESWTAILPPRGLTNEPVVTEALAPKPVSPAQVNARVPNVVPPKVFTPPADTETRTPRSVEPPPAPSGIELNAQSRTVSSLPNQPTPTPPLPVLNQGQRSASPPAATPGSLPAQETAQEASRAAPELVAKPTVTKPAEFLSGQGPASYPPLAQQSHVQGMVVIEVRVGADGKVRQMKVLSGHPLLRDAAEAAVSRWIYRPALANGEPVEGSARAEVVFRGKW